MAEIPQSILDDRVEPIRTALANIDAQKLLDLEVLPLEQTATTTATQTTTATHYRRQPHNLRNNTNAARGPRVRDGVYCRPICDQIRPTLDIDDDDDVAMGDNINNINNNDNMTNKNNKSSSSSVVRYLHIAEVPDEYTIGIFVFGPHEKIPLHDHPEMCVLSRVLYGDLERLSLDLDRKGRTPNNDEDYDFVFGNTTNNNNSNINSNNNNNSYMDTTDEDEGDPNDASSSSIRHFLEHKTQSSNSVENTTNNNTNHNESSSSSVFMAALSRSATWLHDNLYTNTSSGSCSMDDESDPQHPYHYQYNQQQPQKERFPEGTKVAYRNTIDVLEAPNVASLYPYEGNLHEFVAGPYGAAVLDVLLPPYDDERKRDCTFYNIRETTTATTTPIPIPTIAIQPTSTTHRGNGVSNVTATATATTTSTATATATGTVIPNNPPHEALDRSVPLLSSLGPPPLPREDSGNNHNNKTMRDKRQPCLIVPTGQPENFHCISGRYKDLGDADDYYDSQYDDV